MENSIDLTNSQQRKCPKCNAPIEFNEGYLSWCRECGWNMKQEDINEVIGILDKMYIHLRKKYSKSILNEILEKENTKVKSNFIKFIGIFIAVIVHFITLIIALIGLVTIIKYNNNWLKILGGVFLLAWAFLICPRTNKRPKEIVNREKFPVLYNIIDNIASELKTNSVDGVVITDEFNISFTKFGLNQKRIMNIGLPLFQILSYEERVAVLTNKLAQGANYDSGSNFIVETAIKSLLNWYDLIAPKRLVGGVVMKLCIMIAYLISKIFLLIIYLMIYLTWPGSQLAKYKSDYDAARMCGTEAMISSMKKFYFAHKFQSVIQKVALDNDNVNLFDEFKKQISQMPKSEIERIERVCQIESNGLNFIDIPAAYRIKFLKEKAYVKCNINLSKEKIKLLDIEIDSFNEKIQDNIIGDFKQSLYKQENINLQSLRVQEFKKVYKTMGFKRSIF